MSLANPDWTDWETAGLARSLFEAQATALLLVDPVTETLLDANGYACRLAGAARQELLGRHLDDLVQPESDWHLGVAILDESASTVEKRYRFRTAVPDGWLPVGVSVQRLPAAEGRAFALVTLLDRRNETESLARQQRSEADLRRALASVSDCLWNCRLEPGGVRRYRYLSPALRRLTGRDVGTFLEDPRAWEQSVDPDDRSTWQQFQQRLQEGRSGGIEYRLRRPDGSRVWVHENVIAAHEDGEMTLHGTISDISERKNRESAPSTLSNRTDRLDAVARLAGTIGHDLSNLVTGILGHLSLARPTTPGAAPVREEVDRAEAIALRAAELCRHLASVAGSLRGGGRVADVAVQVRSVLAALPGRRCVPLEAEGNLPPILIDEGQLRLVLEQLVRNATAAGSGEIVVRVGAGRPVEPEWPLCFSYKSDERAGPMVTIEVRDSGSGISDSVRERLGEPFTPRPDGGRGMGLALVLGVVRGCGGEMTISTRSGQGTVVRVRFPAAPAPVLASVPPSSKAGWTVLLADDEETVLDVSSRLLRSIGCEVIATRNGEEAVARFQARPELVQMALIDLTMPRLSGDATLRELRRLAPALPLVLMSGYAENDVAPRFADVGLAGYLQKPFRLPVLQDLLRRLKPS